LLDNSNDYDICSHLYQAIDGGFTVHDPKLQHTNLMEIYSASTILINDFTCFQLPSALLGLPS
jgi:hypothetical protein